MTSIASLSNSDPSAYLSAIKSTGSAAVSSDGDEGSSAQPVAGHRHRGSGGMGKALMETMQQLGMTPPPPRPSDAATVASSASDSSSSDDSLTSATGDLRSDFGAFMAQLFQALQSEASNSSSSASTSDSSASTPGGRFATALSSLSTDAAKGNAPDGLQAAFKQLMQDLQGAGTNSDSGSASGKPDLQTFLSTLQQNLAQHGQHQWAVGNVVSTQA